MGQRSSLLLTAAVAAVCLSSPSQAAAATLPADSTAILSGTPSLTDTLPQGVGQSWSESASAVSRDGRYVTFASEADGLSDEDDDRVRNVYVKDTQTGAVTLVSRATGPAGEPSHSYCSMGSISDDGLAVAFACFSKLDPDDTNDREDVYVRRLDTRETVLVSRVSGLGAVGDADSNAPVLSEGGRYVVFETRAKNLVGSETYGLSFVVRREIGGQNEVVLVSRVSGPNGAAGRGSEPSVSDDGNLVAFTNIGAPGISGNDNNGAPDVYIRDISAGTTSLVSRASGSGGQIGNSASEAPVIAGEGTAVAFASRSTNFDNANDSNPDSDIYWRAIGGTNTTSLVSINPLTNEKGEDSYQPSISRNGMVVSFTSAGRRLHADDNNARADTFVKNLALNTLEVVSRADGDSGAVANVDSYRSSVSGDGTRVVTTLSRPTILPGAEPRETTVMLRDIAATPRRTLHVARPAGDAPFVNQGGASGGPVLSADGRYAAFFTQASGLGLPADVREGIVVRDRVTGEVEFVSRADGPAGAPVPGTPTSVAISADGRRVAWATDTGVWVRDRIAQRTFEAGRGDGPNGAMPNGAIFDVALDGDGSRVAFSTTSTNLGDGDTDTLADVHVRDLATERTILASRTDGPAGAKGDSSSYGPDFSDDGERVLFTSDADNIAGTPGAYPQAVVRDLAGETTRVVSVAPDGAIANRFVTGATWDAAGGHVAFASSATNLGPDTPVSRIYVRDVATGSLQVVSRLDGPDGPEPNGDSYAPEISPDGGYVTFTSQSSDLVPGVPRSPENAYWRDIAGGRTAVVSRGNGADRLFADRAVTGLSISAGGSCVAFNTESPLVGARTDTNQVYMRVFRDDCAVPPAPNGGDGGPGGGGGGAGGEGPGKVDDGRDKLAPKLTAAKLSRKRIRPKQRAALTFRSDEAATLEITYDWVRGKRMKRAAVAKHLVRAGKGRINVTWKVGKKKLAAGTYRMTLVARDAAGNTSKPVRLKLTILKKKG